MIVETLEKKANSSDPREEKVEAKERLKKMYSI